MSDMVSPEGESKIPPVPNVTDTDSIKVWMKTYIQKPPAGFDDMKHEDGTPFTKDEQIDAFIGQTVAIIEHRKRRNDPQESYKPLEIMLLNLVQPENPTSERK